MTDVIEELVKKLWPERHVIIQPLLGGITNANYFVDFGDEQVVVRIPGDNTALLGIDRNHETAANHLASSIGIAPDVLARSESEGWMVTRFLPGHPEPILPPAKTGTFVIPRESLPPDEIGQK